MGILCGCAFVHVAKVSGQYGMAEMQAQSLAGLAKGPIVPIASSVRTMAPSLLTGDLMDRTTTF
jgi:hypothetical protein